MSKDAVHIDAGIAAHLELPCGFCAQTFPALHFLPGDDGIEQHSMKAEAERLGTMIPYTPREGQYHDLDMQDGIYFWTNGFWPGMLWQMYNATGDIDRNQNWLIGQVRERTGRYFDDSYLHKILTGQRNAPKLARAIREVLDLPDDPTA